MIHINPDLDKTVAENECMIDCWGHDGLVVSMFALHYLGRGSNPAFSLYARSTCASSWFPPLGGGGCRLPWDKLLCDPMQDMWDG